MRKSDGEVIKTTENRSIDFRNGLKVIARIRKTQTEANKTGNGKFLDALKNRIKDARSK